MSVNSQKFAFECDACQPRFCHKIATIAEFVHHFEKVHLKKKELSDPHQFQAEMVQKDGHHFVSFGPYLIKTQDSKVNPKHICKFCGMDFKKGQLFNHIHSVHDQTCPCCPEAPKWTTLSKFIQHTKSNMHRQKRNKYVCSECKFATRIQDIFWNHRLINHKASLRQVLELENIQKYP